MIYKWVEDLFDKIILKIFFNFFNLSEYYADPFAVKYYFAIQAENKNPVNRPFKKFINKFIYFL